MSIRANDPLRMWASSVTPPKIFAPRNRLKMRGIDASPIPAHMVKFKANGNSTYRFLITETVRQHRVVVPGIESPVPILAHKASPDPTGRILSLHFLPESFFRCPGPWTSFDARRHRFLFLVPGFASGPFSGRSGLGVLSALTTQREQWPHRHQSHHATKAMAPAARTICATSRSVARPWSRSFIGRAPGGPVLFGSWRQASLRTGRARRRLRWVEANPLG